MRNGGTEFTTSSPPTRERLTSYAKMSGNKIPIQSIVNQSTNGPDTRMGYYRASRPSVQVPRKASIRRSVFLHAINPCTWCPNASHTHHNAWIVKDTQTLLSRFLCSHALGCLLFTNELQTSHPTLWAEKNKAFVPRLVTESLLDNYPFLAIKELELSSGTKHFMNHVLLHDFHGCPYHIHFGLASMACTSSCPLAFFSSIARTNASPLCFIFVLFLLDPTGFTFLSWPTTNKPNNYILYSLP